MRILSDISVFCGSSLGSDSLYEEKAYELGMFLAEQEVIVVYGGAKIGLMGAVADGALANGGEVIGVIPDFLQTKEIAHQGITNLIVVSTMHERKTIMYDATDGAIILPGGFGTMDEMFELLTWGQLGLHTKPIGLLNINGYYDDLIRFIDNMVDKKLLKQSNRDMLIVHDDIYELFELMSSYEAPKVTKWIPTGKQ